MNTFTEAEAEQLRAAKALMVTLGWKARDLAQKAGLAQGTVYNVLAGCNRSWKARSALNAAFGREIFTRLD